MSQTLHRKDGGFAMIEMVLALVFVVLLIVGGFMVWRRSHMNKGSSASTTSIGTTPSQTATQAPVATADVPAAPAVSTASDLDQATATLNNTNIDAGTQDNTQLDSDLSGF